MQIIKFDNRESYMYGLQRYNGIEKEFIEAQYYVSFDLDSVYSEFFTREIILIGSEIESAFKELCHRIDGSTPGNMCDYKSIITHMPRITEISVRNKQNGRCCYPFREWNDGKLHWWTVYTELKHNIVDEKANLGIALEMLQAYLLLLFCITAMVSNVNIDYLHFPKLFEVDFSVGAAIIPSMDYVIIYDRKEILNSLGYR